MLENDSIAERISLGNETSFRSSETLLREVAAISLLVTQIESAAIEARF